MRILFVVFRRILNELKKIVTDTEKGQPRGDQCKTPITLLYISLNFLKFPVNMPK